MSTAPGNPEICNLLRYFLKQAEDHPFGHCAVALTGRGEIEGKRQQANAILDYAGEVVLEPATIKALDILHARISLSIRNRSMPERDPNLDDTYVCYNVASGPIGYDFVTWLVYQEMLRQRNNLPRPLKIGFWEGRSEDMSTTKSKQWVDKVFKPSLKYVGAIEDPKAIYGRFDETYVYSPLITDVKNKLPIVLLSPPEVPKTNIITITLREKTDEPSRNSNNDHWLRFAKYLIDQGEEVVIVRDTVKAEEPLEGFNTNPKASVDLDERFKLYASAKMNFFVENGPAALCIFSELPYIQFWDVDGSQRLRSEKFVKDGCNMELGDQFPWSSPNQHLIWKSPSYENILESWTTFSTS